MSNLFERIGWADPQFRPRSVGEFFALQLARRLADEANVDQYARLAENHPRDLILRAFARANKKAGGATVANRFEEEIHRSTSNS